MLKPHEVMKLPEGKHCDGDYLWLAVKGASRSWVVRGPMTNGKRREVGLGSAVKVSLALARKHRDALLEQWRNGLDPVEEKRKAKQAAATAAKRKTFAEAAEAVIEKNRPGWKVSLEGRCSTLDQWRRDVTATCKPIARKFVDEVAIADVKSVLQAYWDRGQLDSASSLRKRIEATLDYATAHGWRAGDNPASWNIFKHLWPGERKADAHHAALPWREAPEFMARLRQSEATSARLIEFILLTATRSNEARGATWSEIDLDARVWTIPAARMKKGRDHDVPLSDQAIALLRRMEADQRALRPPIVRYTLGVEQEYNGAQKAGSGFVFVGGRGAGRENGEPMRNASLWSLMQRTTGEATTHGLRSSFRDWCGETGVDRELAERCIAHKVGSDAENAYARSSLIERRRPIMEAWADFVNGVKPKDNVVPFEKRVA
jgi:integrase